MCSRNGAVDGTGTRRLRIATIVLTLLLMSPAWAADPAFDRFLAGLYRAAEQLGVSRATFDAATAGSSPLALPDLVILGRPDRQRRSWSSCRRPRNT